MIAYSLRNLFCGAFHLLFAHDMHSVSTSNLRRLWFGCDFGKHDGYSLWLLAHKHDVCIGSAATEYLFDDRLSIHAVWAPRWVA